MITVGFGDVVPVTNDEKIFTIFAMLVACVIFAYSMNTMGNALSEMNYMSDEFKKEMNSVSHYLKHK